MTNGSTDSPQLQEYLRRIGFSGAPRADLDTLRRLHRGHLAAIPYENLDVQLGRRIGFDRAANFDKLVRSRRGGWCFEMNGLLAWALVKVVDGQGVTQRTIADFDDYREVMERRFGIDMPRLPQLWHKVSERHAEWLRRQTEG